MKRKIFRILGLFVALGILVGGIYLLIPKQYHGYEILKETPRADSNTVRYTAYQEGVLKYSRDGAAAEDSNGTTLWNGSYNMKNPVADISQEYVVIADIGSKEFYVYNGNDSGIRMETNLPILMARVASQGVVAVVLEDKTSNTIVLYNPYDSGAPVISEIPTQVSEDGYPVSIAISQDGIRLATNYVKVSTGVLETRLTFYNFGEVGKQEENHIVSSRDYGQVLIGSMYFVGEDQFVAFTSQGLSVFRGKQIPQEVYTVKVTGETEEEEPPEIHSVLFGESYAGLVLETSTEETYEVRLYHYNKETPWRKFILEGAYDTILAGEKELILTQGNTCKVVTTRGRVRGEFSVPGEVTYFCQIYKDRYCLVDDTSLIRLKLKRKGEE